MFKNYKKLRKHILETDFLHCLLIFTNRKIFESADRKTSIDFENFRKRRNHARKNALLGLWCCSKLESFVSTTKFFGFTVLSEKFDERSGNSKISFERVIYGVFMATKS